MIHKVIQYLIVVACLIPIIMCQFILESILVNYRSQNLNQLITNLKFFRHEFDILLHTLMINKMQ